MKTRLIILALMSAPAAFAQGTALPYVEGADPMQIFGIGLGTQLTFEMGGLVIRFVRTLKASGNVDVGG
jgi:hypothetical protein